MEEEAAKQRLKRQVGASSNVLRKEIDRMSYYHHCVKA